MNPIFFRQRLRVMIALEHGLINYTDTKAFVGSRIPSSSGRHSEHGLINYLYRYQSICGVKKPIFFR
jgi:hypothetical protein